MSFVIPDFYGKYDCKNFSRSFANASRKKDRKIAIATLALLVAKNTFFVILFVISHLSI